MKQATRIAEAVEMIPDGATLMIGGFLAVGTPERLVAALARRGRRDLTVIGNDSAKPGIGIGRLISAKCVKRLIVSHIGTNPETQKQMLAGELEVELVPQGTLAERIRAGGYGLGGVLTPTGVGTLAAEGKQSIEIDGQTFLVERPLRADFALIHASQSDYYGNLVYSLTARNFNPLMAMAAKKVIAEADQIVPIGVLPPDQIQTSGVLVDILLERRSSDGPETPDREARRA
jgi:acetate CoA/acetoacetate CoA-transferase alpha subunit